MSRCGRTSQLEALVHGELSHGSGADLRAHAKDCAMCRHELNWLETESSLFRQRAGRDEVAHLWSGVERKRGAARPWRRVLVAMAAAAAVLLVAGLGVRPAVGPGGMNEETLESDALMSPVLFMGEEESCSRLPSGIGFQCAPPVPASFIASR